MELKRFSVYLRFTEFPWQKHERMLAPINIFLYVKYFSRSIDTQAANTQKTEVCFITAESGGKTITFLFTKRCGDESQTTRSLDNSPQTTRVLLKTIPRPATRGPRPATAGGPEARRPGGPDTCGPRPSTALDGPRRPAAHDGAAAQSRFSTVFCPAVNPCACTGLHWVWVCKVDDGEFEFVYHYNIKQSFRSFHSLHVAT